VSIVNFEARGMIKLLGGVNGYRVTTLTRDEEGRVIRRQDAGGEAAEFVERIEYEGDFPPGFECDGLPATPEGLPEPRVLAWLNAAI
jgi:hypothetical protein